MKKEEIDAITRAFYRNHDSAPSAFAYIATIATIIEILRGDVKGVQSPLSNLALNPSNPEAAAEQTLDADPNPVATEVLKRLGALGMQSMSELKGYKIDDSNRVLLCINGRYADSGWVSTDPHLHELKELMRGVGVSLSALS